MSAARAACKSGPSQPWLKIKNTRPPAATPAVDGTFQAGRGFIAGMRSESRLVLIGLVAIGATFALALAFYYLP